MKKVVGIVVGLALAVACDVRRRFTPTRPVEVVVHTGPGGGSDVLARAMVLVLEKEKLLPVRAQVANKPGGGGVVAAAYLAEKKGETHTIGIFTGVWLTNPLTSNEAKVSLKDLTPIARLLLEPAVIAVKADAPYKTLADFVNAAKAKPGELKQSGGSITSRDNVVRQQLQKVSGARWQFISFPGGGERIAALLGGHVNMMVIEPNEAGEHIRAGNMRAARAGQRHAAGGIPERADAQGSRLQRHAGPAGARRGRAAGDSARERRLLGRRLQENEPDRIVEEVRGGQPVRGGVPERRRAHQVLR